MNAGKSFTSLCWNLFMKEIWKELGFQSVNIQKYIKKAQTIISFGTFLK